MPLKVKLIHWIKFVKFRDYFVKLKFVLHSRNYYNTVSVHVNGAQLVRYVENSQRT